jgi:Uma2 family endonuclease
MKSYIEPPLTIADLEATPDDGNRYELIEGELHVSTAPSYLHQTILLNIGEAFRRYLRKHPVGEIVPGIGVIFDDFSGVIPDLVFFTMERKGHILTGGRLSAAPDIAIEIVSPGASNERRDRYLKRQLYSTHGVGEYWIVDPGTRSVEIYQKLDETGFVLAENLQIGDELASAFLEGFRLPLNVIFE